MKALSGLHRSEGRTLLRFKHDLDDPSNLFVSWSTGDGDRFKWAGVVCSNSTGHVIELSL
ncbi:hypothetical protein Ddye_026982 [Dipteronia dyeriana]|uniref:Leucine-rich repeat-containing N-terminal plant-type domain-containing protein n=1 Tax=Dipteronia dyeriana TaxID=168575 RepID=A0AAD9TN83_9ROSI|nr:hypothetical protein Ddye_026982 [Dipteronia dyeriana]